MPEKPQDVEHCAGCGLAVSGGTAGCQAIMDELMVRDFSDVLYFRMHRLMVDTYSLQHPDRYCVSAKSFAAHFTGLCWLMEYEGNRAVGGEALRRWLSGNPKIEKPALPLFRGALTIASVRDVKDAVDYGAAMDRWAQTIWAAYAELQPLAREWIQRALSGDGRSKR